MRPLNIFHGVDKATSIIRSMAVSYTHLDVYKRQPYYLDGWPRSEHLRTKVTDSQGMQNSWLNALKTMLQPFASIIYIYISRPLSFFFVSWVATQGLETWKKLHSDIKGRGTPIMAFFRALYIIDVYKRQVVESATLLNPILKMFSRKGVLIVGTPCSF